MKKRILALLIFGIISASLAACGGSGQSASTSESSSSSDTKELSTTPTPTPSPTVEISSAINEEKEFKTMLFTVPSNAEYSTDESSVTIAPDSPGELIMIQVADVSDLDQETIDLTNDYALLTSMGAYNPENEEYFDITIDGQPASGATGIADIDGTYFSMSWVAVTDPASTYAYIITYGVSSDEGSLDYEAFLNSISFSVEAPSTTTPTPTATPEPTTTPEPTPEVPMEYRNALSKAYDYLDYTAFSYSGLIDQLEYEGYSTEACTYAVDNCGADWNAQAAKKAKDYLEYTSFSYSGLIGQLEYEGFTTEQATYAVDNCGADWNEQAALKAQDYLDYTSFSRQGLIDQLIYEGFTAEQAEYGVSAVGY